MEQHHARVGRRERCTMAGTSKSMTLSREACQQLPNERGGEVEGIVAVAKQRDGEYEGDKAPAACSSES